MFKRDTNRTPKQRAEKAMMNIFARLGGCGFLIYFVVQLLTAPADQKPDATTATIISIVFLLITAFLVFITIQDLVIGFKTGRFKESTYEEMDYVELQEQQQKAAAGEAVTAEQEALDAPEEADAPVEDAESEEK